MTIVSSRRRRKSRAVAKATVIPSPETGPPRASTVAHHWSRFSMLSRFYWWNSQHLGHSAGWSGRGTNLHNAFRLDYAKRLPENQRMQVGVGDTAHLTSKPAHSYSGVQGNTYQLELAGGIGK
jgi:hypothetical protein